uniref:SFRICE_030821 n=1 Tax=Spodoptera frugiperda TaxID=7108 RepID=A0A2H1WY78_SPOFR
MVDTPPHWIRLGAASSRACNQAPHRTPQEVQLVSSCACSHRLRDVAACAHAAHDEESLYDSKLVELFSIISVNEQMSSDGKQSSPLMDGPETLNVSVNQLNNHGLFTYIKGEKL